MLITFKNPFSVVPKVLFSILGMSHTTGIMKNYEVVAGTVTTTTMAVYSSLSDSNSYIHVQYFAYEPSDKFFSGAFTSTSLLGLLGLGSIIDIPDLG